MGACTSKSVLKNVDDAPLPEEVREDVAVEEVKVDKEVAAPPAVNVVEEIGLLIEKKEEEKVSSESEAEQVKKVDEPKECAEAVADVVEAEKIIEKEIVGTCEEKVEVSEVVEVSEENPVETKVSSTETEASEDKPEAEVTSEDTKVEEEKKVEDKKPLFKLWF